MGGLLGKCWIVCDLRGGKGDLKNGGVLIYDDFSRSDTNAVDCHFTCEAYFRIFGYKTVKTRWTRGLRSRKSN